MTIERFAGGRWRPMATVALKADPLLGMGGATVTAYETDYAIDHLDRCDAAALSAAIPMALRQLRTRLQDLARLAAGAGIPADILQRQRLSIRAVLDSLAAV